MDGIGKVGGGGGVVGEAAKLGVQLLQQAAPSSNALGMPVASSSQNPLSRSRI